MQKRNKILVVFLSILGLLLIVLSTYYLLNKANAADIVIDLDNQKQLFIKNPPYSVEGSRYRLQSDTGNIVIWSDNSENTGSTKSFFTYYANPEGYFDTTTPETETVNGITYEYVSKTDGADADGSGIGVVIDRTNPVTVNNYKIYNVISYYNPVGEESSSGDFLGLDNVSGIKMSCLLELNQIDPQVNGLLEYSTSSATEGYQSCDTYFDNDFSIEIR
jgi:hypothetical protein